MINIFEQFSLHPDAVLGSTEGKLYYGNLNPIVDDLSVIPIGSYYLRDFECTMHLRYGPNLGDWTILNAGSANRALGAFVRTRYTENIVLTGNTSAPVPFGVFDISTAPNVVRSPNSSSITMIESGTYVIQYWFSAIGNPTDLGIELSIDGEVLAQDRDIVTGIAVAKGLDANKTLTIRAINDTGNNITLQEFHCLVFKIDTPSIVTEEIVDGNSQTVNVEDDEGQIVPVNQIGVGSGLQRTIVDGSVQFEIDPSIIPVIPEIPAEKFVEVTDGTNTETDVSKVNIGSNLTLTKNAVGEVTLDADDQIAGGSSAKYFSAYSTYTQSVSWYTRDINWDMERRKDTTHFRHDIGSTDVEILVDGWYKVSYDVSIRCSSSSRSQSRTWLMVDGKELDGSEAYAYHRTTSQSYQTCSAKSVVWLLAGSKVGVRSVRQSGGSTLYTIPYASRLNIETA